MVVENSPSYHTTSNDVENFPNDVDNLSALEIIQVLRNLLQEKYISADRRTFGEKLLHVLESSLPEKPTTKNIQNEQGAERNKAFSIKHLLESSIHPLKDKIKIKDVRKIRNQGLAVDCEDEGDVQKILSSIQNQEELKKNITHVQPRGKLPKVIFYNISNDIKEPELTEVIRLRSGVADETIKVKFMLKGRREGTSHWVVKLRLPHSIFSRKIKKILLNWTAYSIREFIGVRRCFKCQNFGHTQKIAKTTFPSAHSVQEDMTLGIALAIILNASTALSQTITKRPIMILGIQKQMEIAHAS
ncbi:hypothetical protein AVEN_13793-1 [Araneus ventricosus]|uniref:Uncharacterized protein n=1 Tax=Araneus ventricosus TaxID=182803 RepID=A0A4Y2VN41_ARAVE|nr:hypothetical protein AVEN_13793-1 [Araneus ventricosus]